MSGAAFFANSRTASQARVGLQNKYWRRVMKTPAFVKGSWTPPILVPLALAVIVLVVALMRALH
jgi:hypothetical protein